MKKLFSWFLIVALLSCNSSNDVPDMPGTYLMNSQILKNDSTETKYTSLKQLKIYTDSFFMYTNVNPGDSVSAFGVGSYTPGNVMITENVIYSSADSTVGTPKSYDLTINKVHEGYTQVIPEIVVQGKPAKLTEDYREVGKELDTPLDGVWKEVRSYDIVGNDTIPKNRVQYKAYNDGYFMFGHFLPDSSRRGRTGIGFGTYEMINDSQIKETDLNSTYAIIAGNSFMVDIAMDGSDRYVQTIIDSTGTKSVEHYERLKK
ncbi:hypothetical protein BH20BAC1_BH20BAC1_20020 [soil metagenome]